MSLTAVLDNRLAIEKIDPDGALASAESMADQVRQVWEEQGQIDLSQYKNNHVQNIVVAGMGGSALGADLVKNLYKTELPVSMEICKDYDLPNYVDQNTLVILSSYSGNTQETLSCALQAEKRGAMIAIITAGGQLAALAKDKKYPGYIINPKFNPSKQPRMATVYNIMAIIIILNKLALLQFDEEHFHQVMDAINRTSQNCLVEIPQEQNQAKILAFMFLERRPILVGGSFLEGALHIGANQLNENAKIFADYKIVPEINHHLMEGLTFPKSNGLNHFFVFFQSNLYRSEIAKRITLTKKAVEKVGIETLEIPLVSETKLMQVFELITLNTFANLYLSYLEGMNPCPIPMVDWFKAELEK
ncbi:MAG TPA: SIS domain-containing protein [Candidatus Woesebacteria bacterium]|nr:SIS domain-containing protein [Candidatus Woesebacteria bacterium]